MSRDPEPFDVDEFLARSLTARLATRGPNGPTVRPVWYLWEDRAFWVITGPWARLPEQVRKDPRVALVVDECDLGAGLVRQVTARGRAELLPFDAERGWRKLSRYLGTDESRWDPRFVRYLRADPEELGTRWLRLVPEALNAKDLSYLVEA
ncbi:pyridoxamine 5'-phosphate oxidase family protein [Streptomyces sp. NPDC002851]